MKQSLKAKKISFILILASLALIVALAFGVCTSHSQILKSRGDAATAGAYGVRFTKVVSGSDFGLGLTYNGRVYIWSTASTHSEYGTLGQYYYVDGNPYLMRDITPTFKAGPGTANTPIKYTNVTSYHQTAPNRTAVNIAATRYTAAIVDSAGYIYTLGRDESNSPYSDYYMTKSNEAGRASHYLLMRNLKTDSQSNHCGNWYEPDIINYDETSGSAPVYNNNQITNINNVKIEGAEFNYIMAFTTTSNNITSFYIWGSQAYNVPLAESLVHDSTTIAGATYHDTYKVATVTNLNIDNVDLVAGGHTVGYVNSNRLYIRGANVYFTSSNSNAVFNLATNSRDVNGVRHAIAGASYNITSNEASTSIGFSQVEGSFLNDSTSAVRNSSDNPLATGSGISNVSITSELSSLGNQTSLSCAASTNLNTVGSGGINYDFGISGNPAILSVAAGNRTTHFENSTAQMLNFSKTGNMYLAPAACALNAGVWTGVLTNGMLYCGYNTTAGSTTPPTIEYRPIDVAGKNLISLTSGYDASCMYALSSYGKIYRIYLSGADVEVGIMENYGSSASVTQSDMPLYELNSTSYFDLGAIGEFKKYTVNININTATRGADRIAPVNNFDGSANANSLLTVNGASMAQGGTSFNLIGSNNSGDLLRFASTADEGVNFVSPHSDFSPGIFTAKFYAEEGENRIALTETQAFNMFDCTIEHGSGVSDNSTLSITPKRSTNGKSIVCSVYVMRYDKGGTAYDFEQISFKFTVANNAPTTRGTNGFYDGEKSSVPPLDVNNEYTKTYSFAVQDVSMGLKELATYLNVATANTIGEVTYNDFVPKIEAADGGFPAINKRTAGDLDYYLGQSRAEEYYNDKYLYLYTDIDADKIELTPRDGAPSDSMVDISRREVVLSFSTSAGTGSTEARLAEWLYNADSSGNFQPALYNSLKQDFNNLYGLTIGEPQKNSTTGIMSFTISYNIVEFTAKEPSAGINYTDDNVLSEINLTKNGTAVNSKAIPEYFDVTERSTYDYANKVLEADFSYVTANPNVNIIIDASLRVSDGTKVYNGNNNTVNLARRVQLGNETTIALSDLLASTTYISYTLDNQFTSDQLSLISSRFPDATGSGKTVVQLTSSELKIFPTDTNTLYIKVGLQRFAGEPSENHYFYNSSNRIDENIIERITLVITVSVYTNSTEALLTKNNNADTAVSINNDSILNLVSGAGSVNRNPFFNCSAAYTGDLTIRTFSSSDTSILTVETVENSNTMLKLVPRATGSVTVTFVLQLYSYVLPSSVIVNVTKTTYLDQTVDVVAVNYLNVNSIMSKLGVATDAYKLPLDAESGLVDVEDAIYFTDSQGAVVEPNHGWPDFVSDISIVAESPMRIRIAPNLQSTSTSGSYDMHVRFIPSGYNTLEEVTDLSSVLEAVLSVSCSRKFATAEGSDSIYIIDINTDEYLVDTNGDWYYDSAEKRVIVTLEKLLGKITTSTTILADNYNIVLVSAQDTAAYQYVDNIIGGNGKSLYIRPLYNTVNSATDDCFLYNVSIKDISGANSMIISFYVRVTGITTVLSQGEYTQIVTVSFVISAVIVILYFIVAVIIYLNRRSKQREIIRKNRELIKMRDQVHSKGAGGASSQDIVSAKLKLQDPKYQKMLSKIKKKKSYDDNTIIADNVSSNTSPSDFTQAQIVTETRTEKKGKKQKKSVEELKAEMKQRQSSMNTDQSSAPTFNDMFKNMDGDTDGVLDVEVVDFDNK